MVRRKKVNYVWRVVVNGFRMKLTQFREVGLRDCSKGGMPPTTVAKTGKHYKASSGARQQIRYLSVVRARCRAGSRENVLAPGGKPKWSLNRCHVIDATLGGFSDKCLSLTEFDAHQRTPPPRKTSATACLYTSGDWTRPITTRRMNRLRGARSGCANGGLRWRVP